MRKITIFLVVFVVTFMFKALAERINIPGLAIPKLIITEVRPDAESTTYIEITNMGDTAINLEPFTLHSVHFNTRCTAYSDSLISFFRGSAPVDNSVSNVYLKGLIQPGESYVVATVWDGDYAGKSGITNHNTAIAQIGKQFVHKAEPNNLNTWINKPEWQCFGKDSISANAQLLRGELSVGYLLHWKFLNQEGMIDSTYIDQFNHFWYPENNEAEGLSRSMKGYGVYPIAGVVDAMTTSVAIRKSNITKGNLNWNQSRGTDAISSEWLIVPKNTSKNMAFRTVGSHGTYNLSYPVKNASVVSIDESAKTISVPWQIVRGDSLARYFNLGKGMAWSYVQNSIFADSASYIARTEDKFIFYSVGTSLNQEEFSLNVRDAEPDLAVVFPKRRLMEEIELVFNEVQNSTDTLRTYSWSNGFAYAISEGTEIDSIINVGYSLRTDSLLKYLDKPAKATWGIVFHDGQNRVDLQFGDKLKVTSENGLKTKEYFIAVNDYAAGNNALLRNVTWPDIDPEQYPRWNKGDTLPDFTALKTQYNVELAYDAKKIPAFQFKTQDLRARISVKNATNLNGTAEQRTTSVTVTAESDTISLTYTFLFSKQGVPVQPNNADPFISEYVWSVTTQGFAAELYNPGTEELDLSRYLYLTGSPTQTWQEAVKTLVGATTSGFTTAPFDGIKAYQTHYVPSKRWVADGSLEAWSATPTPENPYIGRGFLKDDNQTDPWVKGNDVWVMGIGASNTAEQNKILAESDFVFRGNNVGANKEAWPGTLLMHRETPIWNTPRHNMWLLKILNDSILDGTKDVRDETAYELIDRFEMIKDSLAGRFIGSQGGVWTLIRKPHVTKGNLERIGGGNETAETSEWIVKNVTDAGWSNSLAVSNVGIHTMTPVTNYLSTVTSVKLIVKPGYMDEDLTITGNIADYTPVSIALVLDKADASQTFVFKRGATVLADTDPLMAGDVLEVTAGDNSLTTKYTLVNSPLDNNTSLVAKAGSGLTVSADKVKGVQVGTKLKDALDNLVVAAKSVLYVLDAKGALQPLKVHNLDSLVLDVLVSEDLMLQVVAENNDKANYYFDFELASNQAVLLSNVIEINETTKLLVNLPVNVTVSSLSKMVFTNKGATMKVLDKAGFERTLGILNFDDVIEVTAPDGIAKVSYKLNESVYSSVKQLKDELAIAYNLYPNPVSYVLYISGIEVSTVKVYSLTGVLMIANNKVHDNTIVVRALSNGVYVIEITDNNGRVVKNKFLKK